MGCGDGGFIHSWGNSLTRGGLDCIPSDALAMALPREAEGGERERISGNSLSPALLLFVDTTKGEQEGGEDGRETCTGSALAVKIISARRSSLPRDIIRSDVGLSSR